MWNGAKRSFKLYLTLSNDKLGERECDWLNPIANVETTHLCPVIPPQLTPYSIPRIIGTEMLHWIWLSRPYYVITWNY